MLFASATFTYDGDGRRVGSVMQTNYATATTRFVGIYYEVTGSSITKYYYAGAQRIAMRNETGLFYLLSDHLGSTSLVIGTDGAVVSEMKYTAWGEVRSASGAAPTNYTYTGQYSYTGDFGLMFYNARWYDPYLNHFIQPDTIVPDPYNPQSYDRYAYALNNPLRYTDPTGHDVDCGIGDSYCSDAWQKYHRSKWREIVPGRPSFKEFMQAQDTYEYYQRHPEKAVEDTKGPNGTYEEKDSITLAKIYSENVLHKWFDPISYEQGIQEIDKFVVSRKPMTQWMMTVIFGTGIFAWMSQDEGGGGGGALDISPSQSSVWKNLDHYRGGIKRSGSGRDSRYYQWDYTHGDIEVYDRYGNHLGSMHPLTGELYKPPVKGRTINVK